MPWGIILVVQLLCIYVTCQMPGFELHCHTVLGKIFFILCIICHNLLIYKTVENQSPAKVPTMMALTVCNQSCVGLHISVWVCVNLRCIMLQAIWASLPSGTFGSFTCSLCQILVAWQPHRKTLSQAV